MSVVAATHTVVKSSPASHLFGSGILASRPYAGRMPFTQADLAEAAQMFADAVSEPDYDAMALEAEYQDRYERQAAMSFGHCALCSMPCDDLTSNGMCDACEDRAIDDSTACVNQLYDLGRQVF